MVDKKNICVVFGGMSGEHDVSLMSAYNILNALDKEKYNVSTIGITLYGKWYFYDGDYENIKNKSWLEDKSNLDDNIDFFSDGRIRDIDVFFPIIHGQTGEDGKLQGLFEMIGKAYVGCDVTSSALCMDKDLTKRVLETEKIPVTEGICLYESEITDEKELEKYISDIKKSFSFPVFIKPANMGSSVGISKANDEAELSKALKNAVRFDKKVLVERAVNAREIEVAVLGNFEPEVTMPGEIISCNEFYDYEAKYLSGDSSKINIPADITKEQIEKIQKYAVRAFKVLGCLGLSRIDFFIDKDSGEVYLNEVNTMPGFTNISMYAKMWEAMGVDYTSLIERLIDLGLEMNERKLKRAVKE